jgi:hypothetical protein
MNTPVSQFSLITDLEARQDDLILRLDDLDKRVERTLAECQAYRGSQSSCKTFSTSFAESKLRH